MSVIYFRVLVVLVSLLSTEEQTGLFGTSFRIFEMLLGLPALILSVALPLLSVAGDEDDSRLRRGLQSMTEASLLVAALLVVGIVDPGRAGNSPHRWRRVPRRRARVADPGAGAAPRLPRPDVAARADRGQSAACDGGRQRARRSFSSSPSGSRSSRGRCQGCSLGRRRRRDGARHVPLDRSRTV